MASAKSGAHPTVQYNFKPGILFMREHYHAAMSACIPSERLLGAAK